LEKHGGDGPKLRSPAQSTSRWRFHNSALRERARPLRVAEGGRLLVAKLKILQHAKTPKKRIDYSSQSTDLRVVLFPSPLVVVIYFVPHRTPLALFNCAV
jgi:hypothetical protein